MKKYELSTVKLFGFDLEPRSRSVYQPLSKVRFKLIEHLKNEIKSYLPGNGIDAYKILDPKHFPEDSANQETYGLADIMNLAKRYGIDPMQAASGWKILLPALTSSPDWCTMKKSEVKNFWTYYLENNYIELKDDIRKLIRSVLVTPIGSADAERGFSVLFHVRQKRRSRLTAKNLDNILRLRLNGCKDIALFPAPTFAEMWVKNHLRSDSRERVNPESVSPESPEPPDSMSLDEEDNDNDDNDEDDQNKKYLDGSIMF